MLSLWYIAMYALLSAGIGKIDMKIGKEFMPTIKLCNRKRSLQIMIMANPSLFFRSRCLPSKHKRKGIVCTNPCSTIPARASSQQNAWKSWRISEGGTSNRTAKRSISDSTPPLARNSPMNNSAFETSRPHPRRRLQKSESPA